MKNRKAPLECDTTALLIVDMQVYCAVPGKGLYKNVSSKKIPSEHKYYFTTLAETVIPNVQGLQLLFRSLDREVIYTKIESLTKDGRDNSLDYKLSGLHVPKGSIDAEIIPNLKPKNDEIVIAKTSSSCFNSTNIDYVLRNLGITDLVVCGVVTNQCIDSTVRDAADLGYRVTVVKDACAAHSAAAHNSSLQTLAGYSRVKTTKEVAAELKPSKSKGPEPKKTKKSETSDSGSESESESESESKSKFFFEIRIRRAGKKQLAKKSQTSCRKGWQKSCRQVAERVGEGIR